MFIHWHEYCFVLKSCTNSNDNQLLAGQKEALVKLLDLIPELGSTYCLVKAIGSGTFSRVYLAKHRQKDTTVTSKHVALKHIVPTSHPDRVLMELKCLHKLGYVVFYILSIHDKYNWYLANIFLCVQSWDLALLGLFDSLVWISQHTIDSNFKSIYSLHDVGIFRTQNATIKFHST